MENKPVVKLSEEAPMPASHHLPPPLAGYTFKEHIRSAMTHDTFTATRTEDETDVIIRVYALGYLKGDEERRQMLEREVLVSRMCDHPHIIECFPPFMTPTDLYLVEKAYSGGELFDALESYCRTITNTPPREGERKSMGLPTLLSKRIFRDLMHAVHYLHTKVGVCHRNIKLENINLTEDNRVRLGGLGMAAVLGKPTEEQPEDAQLRLCCGSKHYIAPEIVEGLVYDGREVDVWAAGVVLFALLTCGFPFDSDKGDEAVFQLIGDAEKTLEANPSFHSIDDPLAQDVLRGIFRVDPKVRLSVEEVLEHPFLQD
ncbi:serine/threonine-protein kinase-like protein [Angomonas deanei]|uniref:Protein tyrosine kinase/Protein kinase domain containing protein, putative n=1 Tax=Angomonas deanei TaxID=59799 RepID=S9U2R8_9TRYP|nr:serine/threonine-protein kinase-like protein [Angomonas deanei]EPY26457.1 serine/threonine-protein kinase-like protein [Angomonas deanei]CAD2220895.1 Protein tyrosine kinase/Protein kinase domain containing protein, putative [Angomonas deanei]|eukprot:EPY25072.1 serine/threonine-protein kinase-like protein [Angomonas deanei]